MSVILLSALLLLFACHRVYICIYILSKKLVHQTDIDNFVNSQQIFEIISLTHSAENWR